MEKNFYQFKNKEADILFTNFLKKHSDEDNYPSEQIIQDLQKIINIEPELCEPAIYFYLGDSYKELGNDDKACDYFTISYDYAKQYKLHPLHNCLLNYKFGIVLFNKKKYHQAKYHFQNALEPFCFDDLRPHILEAIHSCEEELNTNNITDTSTKTNNNGCYIVTATAGYNSLELDYFYSFRDNYLKKSSFGKKFITFYYSVSPSIARIISKSYQ